jgi:hypothetical protein
MDSLEGGCGFVEEERRRRRPVKAIAAITANRMIIPLFMALVSLVNEGTAGNVTGSLNFCY